MKKIISFLVGLTLLTVLCACGNETNSGPGPAPVTGQNGAVGEDAEAVDGKTLVAYFSCTGNTKQIAETLAALIGADVYEIVPAEPYSAEDIKHETDCRANNEQGDPNVRPAINGTVENMAEYDLIYLGYPIWWGIPARITQTFLESYDLSGKIIVPFCTSGGSEYNDSSLEEAAPGAEIVTGRRFEAGADREEIVAWVESLGLSVQVDTQGGVS